ncbi:hypothetical protein IGI42_003872 [Enterococcus sp. AZ109]
MCTLFFLSVEGTILKAQATSVGIGFSDEELVADPTPDESPPADDVLPGTAGNGHYQTIRRSTLPKTGAQRQTVFLRMIGLVCLAGCYWLFLFNRLAEEEKVNE